MANTLTSDGARFSLPQYYDKIFLERLQAGPAFLPHTTQKKLTPNSGTVMFFPRMTVSSTMPSAYLLSEGTARTSELFSGTTVTATLVQYGNSKGVSDLALLTTISSTNEEIVKEQADHANNVIDRVIMEASYGCTGVAPPTGVGFSIKWGFDSTMSAGMIATGTDNGTLTTTVLRRVAKTLRQRNVPTFEDGFYHMVLHSDSWTTLQSDTTWQAQYVYTNPETVKMGGMGEYGGIKFYGDNNITQSANGSAGATISYNVLLGKGALGAVSLDGNIKSILKTSGDQTTSDPLNQISTIGWKANFVAVRLNVQSGLIVATADSA
jgi:N4-gp56 family major capsid protein